MRPSFAIGWIAALALACTLAACGPARPRPIAYDSDACEVCRMQISDPRFGGEIITTHGRVHVFDAVECLVSYYRSAGAAGQVASVWVADFTHPGTFLDATTARFVDLGAGRAPMGRGWAAVPNAAAAATLGVTDTLGVKRWSDLR